MDSFITYNPKFNLTDFMNIIDKSIAAIEKYNPKNNIYLCIVGKGQAQYLEVVKVNWFGRLLMKFGCSNASMAKVAQFAANNMKALCSSKLTNLQNPQNFLGQLVGRIGRFHKKHPSKIGRIINNIKSVYNEAVSRAYVKVLPLPAPKFAGAAPIVQAIVVAPPKPKPADLVLIPAAPRIVDPVKESVSRFKAARGHVVKAVASLQPDDLSNAAGEMETVQNLLKESSNTPAVFAALIKEMTPEELGCYLAFGRFAPNVVKNYQHFPDIFEIGGSYRFAPSDIIALAFTQMSLDQLKGLIAPLKTYGADLCVDMRTNAFYIFANLISRVRNRAEQAILFGEMVQQPYYALDILPGALPVFNASPNNAQLRIDTMLAQHYIRYLLHNKSLSAAAQLPYLIKRFDQFLGITHFGQNGVKPNSPLEHKDFLNQLSEPELKELALLIIRTGWISHFFADSVLFKEIMIATADRAAVVFSEWIENHPTQDHCAKMVKAVPGCDKMYIRCLLNVQDLDKIDAFLVTIWEVLDHSAINDLAFIGQLTEDELLMLAEAITKAYNPDGWRCCRHIFGKISKDPKLAVELYKRNKNYDIPALCYAISQDINIVNSIVGSMSALDRMGWEASQQAKGIPSKSLLAEFDEQ